MPDYHRRQQFHQRRPKGTHSVSPTPEGPVPAPALAVLDSAGSSGLARGKGKGPVLQPDPLSSPAPALVGSLFQVLAGLEDVPDVQQSVAWLKQRIQAIPGPKTRCGPGLGPDHQDNPPPPPRGRPPQPKPWGWPKSAYLVTHTPPAQPTDSGQALGSQILAPNYLQSGRISDPTAASSSLQQSRTSDPDPGPNSAVQCSTSRSVVPLVSINSAPSNSSREFSAAMQVEIASPSVT